MKGKTSHFFLFFVFCFSCFFSSVLSARELTKEEVEAVEIGVGQQLKDPYSAKYTHGSYIFEGRSGGVYCGKVNAKNSYGAYIGDRLFAVVFIDTKSDGLLAAPLGRMDSQEVISSLCASSGYDLRVNKIFKDDVNKERTQKGFPKLDDAYFY